MSLRFQISYRIILLSLLIMTIGGAAAIWQARNSVADEVDSSINLALQLMQLGISTAPDSSVSERDWINRLRALQQTRHLNIRMLDKQGRAVVESGERKMDGLDQAPPRWFENLVTSDFPAVAHQVKTQNGKTMTLMIQANPMDEIIEVWQETVHFFITICVLVLLTFGAVQLVFNRSLQAINTIVQTLQLIETGEYRRKLPDFATQEYDSIARAINHMTDVMENSRQQNRALTQHSLQIQEEERQRLSQELHDELGQSLTAIKVLASSAAHRNADVPKITQSITHICDHLMQVVRSMMQQLHPLILTELGLKATLEDLIAHWMARNPALSMELDYDDTVDELDKAVTIQLFRVIQECLTNINRHADADRVKIRLGIENDGSKHLLVSVHDNGRGCEPDKLAGGFGLLGMKERVKSLDGELTFRSSAKTGTMVDIMIPL